MANLNEVKEMFAAFRNMEESTVMNVIGSQIPSGEPIGWKYVVSHDGYDADGPESYLYDLFVLVYTLGGYTIYHYHYEQWFTGKDPTEFEYVGEIDLISYRNNCCYYTPGRNKGMFSDSKDDSEDDFDTTLNKLGKMMYCKEWDAIEKKEERQAEKVKMWNDLTVEDEEVDDSPWAPPPSPTTPSWASGVSESDGRILLTAPSTNSTEHPRRVAWV